MLGGEYKIGFDVVSQSEESHGKTNVVFTTKKLFPATRKYVLPASEQSKIVINSSATMIVGTCGCKGTPVLLKIADKFRKTGTYGNPSFTRCLDFSMCE